jgi:hypothetical protein
LHTFIVVNYFTAWRNIKSVLSFDMSFVTEFSCQLSELERILLSIPSGGKNEKLVEEYCIHVCHVVEPVLKASAAAATCGRLWN